MSFPSDINQGSRILIVDDECAGAELLANLLKKAGYPICITVTDPLLAVERFKQINPDLLLLDLHMAPINGAEVLARINQIVPPALRPPVLVITADTSPEAKHEALEAGATDFLSKPLDLLEVTLRIENLLRTHTLFKQCQYYSLRMETLVQERTAELQQQARELELAIEELKRTQQQVIQQERVRALGAMASGIAHDLNNGLTLILGHGDMLLDEQEKFPEGTAERRHLKEIVRAGRDNAMLVERLRSFYHPCASKEDRTPQDVNDLIGDAITVTAPKWQTVAAARGVTIRIEKDLDRVPKVVASAVELREVLTNLIFNAVDAMPDGGQLLFRTRAETESVILEIADTGAGMSPEVQHRCLEPFYTTKGKGGSGLGLAMCAGIIQRHGGSITFRSAPGRGTTFVVTLPVADEKLVSPEPIPEEPLRHLTVLVVDDQPGIREIVSSYLARDEHVVDIACDGREALAKFYDKRFDIVITDRAMPEHNGYDLAVAVKHLDPHQPIIMLTGFSEIPNEGETPEDLEAQGVVDLVLHKPTSLENLRKAIHYVMRRHAVMGAVDRPKLGGHRAALHEKIAH